MDRASPRGGLPAALPLPNHRAPPPRNDRMKYLPVYLFVGFARHGVFLREEVGLSLIHI